MNEKLIIKKRVHEKGSCVLRVSCDVYNMIEELASKANQSNTQIANTIFRWAHDKIEIVDETKNK